MKKRDSIFSNGSIHGFNSALYLASEFNADSDSDTWIPINECCSDLNKSVLSNPAGLGVDVSPRLVTLKVVEPAKRSAGIVVSDVAQLVEKLKNEVKVI